MASIFFQEASCFTRGKASWKDCCCTYVCRSIRLFFRIELGVQGKRCFFKRELTPHEVIQAIKLREHIPAETNSWLLFLDEIQACPKAMSMLRYFYEEVPELHVIAAGSLLEAVLQSEQISSTID